MALSSVVFGGASAGGPEAGELAESGVQGGAVRGP